MTTLNPIVGVSSLVAQPALSPPLPGAGSPAASEAHATAESSTGAAPAHPFSLDHIPGILKEDDAIKASGFVPWHKVILSAVAKDQNVFLLFRPFNPDCTDLLAEGCVAKPPQIKAKSADWGPMQGYIPFDPGLSKTRRSMDGASNPNVELIGREPDRFKAQDLEISFERAGYLIDKGVLKQLNGAEFICEGVKFKFESGPTGGYAVLHQAPGESGFRPVQVMCDHEGRPFTADYDTFAVYPALSNYHQVYQESLNADHRPARRARWHAIVAAITEGQGREQRKVPDLPSARESNAHRDAREAINARLDEYWGSGEIITHGPEQENLAHFEQDENILVITPEGKVYCTTNWQQTQAVAHAADQQGYLTYDNPTYNQSAGESFSYLDRDYVIPAGKPPPEWNPHEAWRALVSQQ